MTKLQDVIGVNKHPGLNLGPNEIWYKKNESWGKSFDNTGLVIDPNNLSETHALIGSVQSNDPDDIYNMMQMEVWSPNREGHFLLRARSLCCFSMCELDVVVIGGISRHTNVVLKRGFVIIDKPTIFHAHKK